MVTQAEHLGNGTTYYQVFSNSRGAPPKVVLSFFIATDGSYIGCGSDLQTYYRHFPMARSYGWQEAARA